jgi:hypothetical protein
MFLRNVGILPQHYTASQPRGWRQYGPPKRWYPTTTLHGVTTQKTSIWIFTSVKTSNLTPWCFLFLTEFCPRFPTCLSPENHLQGFEAKYVMGLDMGTNHWLNDAHSLHMRGRIWNRNLVFSAHLIPRGYQLSYCVIGEIGGMVIC